MPTGDFTSPGEIDQLILYIEGLKPRKVLDLGIGDGRVVLAFARAWPGVTVVGVEHHSSRVQHVLHAATAEGLENVELHHADARFWLMERIDVVFAHQITAVTLPQAYLPGQTLITTYPLHRFDKERFEVADELLGNAHTFWVYKF